MSSAQACAIRTRSQPRSWVGPEKPKPGIEGITRWKSRESGSITSRNSRNEPGQPCVSTSADASGFADRTWTKWMVWPSISVVKCGSSLSFASCSRQSYSVRQCSASSLRRGSEKP